MGPIADIGAGAIAVAREAGGIALMLARVLRSLVPPSMDGRELLRNLVKMGNQSVPIVALTAFFTGGIMVIQSSVYVQRFGATGLVGWGTGYAVFREVGPILIALMFSGRVGANNTAELGTMVVTEQIDGLRALAINPIRYLVVPRFVAMVVALFCLTVIGDLVAVGGGMVMANVMVGVDPMSFYFSLVNNLQPADFFHGLIKAAVFGGAVALTSCHYGMSVRGGAVGVGRAVNAAVVSAAVSVLLLDFLLTYSLP